MLAEPIPSSPDECEIVCTRVFKGSKELVFLAWANPEHLQNWWGPAGFTNTFHEFDFRPGGMWRFTMHGPEKGNYQNECEFIRIDAPSLIHWKRHSQPLFQVLVTFEEVTANATRVIFKMLFDTEKECSKIKKFAVDKNEENFDKLQVELTRMASI
ncbi:SRPBCC family protein [Rufibacter aurantiacus]|uniref:SRPBCC family protein n=1 Tax=Rufibacter aurantiacus TaxID=2817374 RepID=UPI001B309E14|nr:SRPBCC family protein [Rufibacter aurantiacus]